MPLILVLDGNDIKVARQGTIKKLERLNRSVRVEDWVNVRRIRTIETGFLSNQVGTAREGDRMIARVWRRGFSRDGTPRTPCISNLVFKASTPPRNALRYGVGCWQFSLISVLSRNEGLTRPRYDLTPSGLLSG